MITPVRIHSLRTHTLYSLLSTHTHSPNDSSELSVESPLIFLLEWKLLAPHSTIFLLSSLLLLLFLLLLLLLLFLLLLLLLLPA